MPQTPLHHLFLAYISAFTQLFSCGRFGCQIDGTYLLLPIAYDNLFYMYELRTHIVVDPEIRFGKPCIKGTRITVGDILQLLSGGMTEQEIIADYPELQGIHIRAALAFAAERDAMTKVVAHETVA